MKKKTLDKLGQKLYQQHNDGNWRDSNILARTSNAKIFGNLSLFRVIIHNSRQTAVIIVRTE